MSARWLAGIAGLALLPGVGCLVAAWAPCPPDDGMRWFLLAFNLAPYGCLALSAWGFRHDRRGALAVLLITVPTVLLGVWACWPSEPENDGAACAAGGVFIMASGLQLLLSCVALGWAGVWSSFPPD